MISRGQESEKVAATYSPTWWGRTIGDGGVELFVSEGEKGGPAPLNHPRNHIGEKSETRKT